MGNYTASKVKGSGRESWSIIFRHPIRTDQSGKVGLRIRRGLGTSDEKEAQSLVDQMNEILSDEKFWDLRARETALSKYDSKIVAAFYDAMEPKQINYLELRENEMPLPTSDQGFARVLLVGTTGAGKTTLLRQLIGSDPKKDRFPSTSPNKTTVSDIEVICDEGNYEAVVTFFDLREIRLHVEDCVMESVLAKVKGFDESTVALKLLEHSEQRFRFFYVLGNYEMDADDDEDEYFEDEDEVKDMKQSDQHVSAEERKEFRSILDGFLLQVASLAVLIEKVKQKLSKDLDLNTQDLSIEDRVALEELLDEEIRKSKDFHSLVDDILDELSKRFTQLSGGSLVENFDGWPSVWKFTTDNRESFLETIRGLSSNYAPSFGRLLTPLVQGIRVKGPFMPKWGDSIPRIVFIDGQGIGHTVNTTSSLPTQTAKKFESSDAVILVDSAKQSMQAASLSVLRSLAASGHISKLRICFTHLDELKGDNLPTRKSRVNHVKASLNQAVSHIRETLGPEVAANLDTLFAEQSYFLFKLDRLLAERDQFTIEQLQRLIGNLETSIFVDTESDVIPFYDEANLVFAVQNANRKFHEIWNARLGYSTMPGEPKRHWAKVKALSRRLAHVFDDGEYDQMRPVAELHEQLMQQIRLFLNKPVRWVMPRAVSEEDKKATVDRIAREIYSQLFDFSSKRVWMDQLTPWNQAYDVSGHRSAMKRSEAIRFIFRDGAPIVSEIPNEQSHEFLLTIRQMVRSSIIEKGGRIITAIEGLR